MNVVNAAFPDESSDVRTWPVCARLLPHALAAADHGERLQLAPEATGRLLGCAGLYFNGRVQYAEATHQLETQIDIALLTEGGCYARSPL